MIVSIGMLAYNEADVISLTIDSLLAQSAFRPEASAALGVTHWEMVVVPNGCRDDTGAVADAAFRRALAALPNRNISHRVVELKEPGKSNAWNEFIHRIARADTDVFVMIDTDIEFGHVDTILNCLRELNTNPRAKVVVDTPLKDFLKKDKLSLIERISARGSDMRFEGQIGIAGSFYCARAETLRQVWMPRGLSGEDGFLKGMIVTDCFRIDPDPSRLARAADATHYYEGLTGLKQIFHHELRMVIGTCLNCYFMWDFLKFATDPSGPGAGELIRNRVAHDPEWYRKTIMNQVRNRGFWVMPHGLTLRRFSALKGLGFGRLLRRLPMALAGFLLDIPVFIVANRRLKSGRAIGFW